MRGSRTMFLSESTRLLPLRSGISSVFGSATRTNPAGSPRGEQSSPSGPTVDRMTKGAASMNFAYSALTWSISFRIAVGLIGA